MASLNEYWTSFVEEFGHTVVGVEAADYFKSCKNTLFNKHQLITATLYYEKDQVNELGYTEVNSTYPPPGMDIVKSFQYRSYK